MAPPPPVIFLFMTVGALRSRWSVKYNQQEICALKGSTVFMNGTFSHPLKLRGIKTFWVIDPAHLVEPTDLSKNPGYSGRVEYFTDEQKHFSLRLSDVTKKDEHQYCFRIISNKPDQKWLAQPGIQLRVTELNVIAPEVAEGGRALLTCNTTCSLTDPTFLWYKNGRPLTTKTIKNNQLHLQTVSREDAGSYSCAVGGYQHLRSTNQTLRVRLDPPKNVSVSISPPGEIVEGSSVTLTCSSDANPPVKIYTWFKEGGASPVGSGDSLSPLQSGSYYCEARNEHGAQRSDPVLVVFESASLALYVVVGVSLCGNTALLAVVLWMRSKSRNRNITHHTVNADPNAKEDTYTALQPTARSSDDVYHTLGAVQSSSPDDTYTALDPQSLSSPEYETLAVSSSQ